MKKWGVRSGRYKEGGKREDAEIKRCEEVGSEEWEIQRGLKGICRDKVLRSGGVWVGDTKRAEREKMQR